MLRINDFPNQESLSGKSHFPGWQPQQDETDLTGPYVYRASQVCLCRPGKCHTRAGRLYSDIRCFAHAKERRPNMVHTAVLDILAAGRSTQPNESRSTSL